MLLSITPSTALLNEKPLWFLDAFVSKEYLGETCRKPYLQDQQYRLMSWL